MTTDDQSVGKFDNYVRKLGKSSAGFSGFLLAVGLLLPCGVIATALYSAVQILLLLALLWIPLLWRRLRKEWLDPTSANWALIASVSVFAVLLLSMVIDNGKNGACFR